MKPDKKINKKSRRVIANRNTKILIEESLINAEGDSYINERNQNIRKNIIMDFNVNLTGSFLRVLRKIAPELSKNDSRPNRYNNWSTTGLDLLPYKNSQIKYTTEQTTKILKKIYTDEKYSSYHFDNYGYPYYRSWWTSFN
jgi:hypothetical protein